MQTTEDRQFAELVGSQLRALVVANGTLPAERLVRAEVGSADYILAADGGANALAAMGLTAHAVIGDFDSVAPDSLPDVLRIPAPDQNHTDLDKALDHLISLGYRQIAVIGATGDRLDHTFGAVEMLVKYGRSVTLRLLDDVGCACLADDDTTLSTTAGQVVSLLPVGVVESVSTDGLKWELKGERLAPGVRDGISNVALGESVGIRVRGGNLVVYLHNAPGRSCAG